MHPASPRDHSRLMIVDRKNQTLSHRFFYELPDILNKNHVLVLNRSKVIQARLFPLGNTLENKKEEIFLIKKIDENRHEVMVKPGKKFKLGNEKNITKKLKAKIIKILPDGKRIIEWNMTGEKLDKILEKLGNTPLPPYLKHSTALKEDYQTIYAREKGSSAAPTAGLHFTKNLMNNLKEKNIDTLSLLLHVGPGTFQPVKTKNIENHIMHQEWFSLSKNVAENLNKAKKKGKKIVAVGTTTLRTLETCALERKLKGRTGETDIFIYPGYKFQYVDALITNFHLPKSTLLMLVCAFAGKEFIMKAYREAMKKKYRFFSFGDAMLII